MEIIRSILQALNELGLSDEDKRDCAAVLGPVVPPLMAHIKVQDFMFFSY
jgi:hypothetical protein